MTKITLLFVLITFINTAKAQSLKQSEIQKVNEAVTSFFDGISALDLTLMKQYSTDDLVILESGAIWNIDSIANRLAPLKKMEFKRTNDLKFIKTEVNGNTGWVFYDNRAKMTINGKERSVHWLESAVLIKSGNAWKIKLLHSTTIQPHD